MASTYVNNLRLNEMATGDASGTWGTTTNTNLELIGEALGYGTEAITTNADTHTSTVADGASDAARAMYVKYTGTLDSTCTITIAPNTMKRVQIIENATSGSQSIIIKQGSGSTVTIPTGRVAVVYLDGAGSGGAVVNAFTDLDLAGTLSIAGAVAAATDMTVGDDLTLSSDAAVLGFGADTDVTLTHVADTALLLNSSRQLQFGDSGTYIHQSADGVLDLVADTEIEINATTIDMNGAVDISGNALVSGEVQTANIGYTDGDNAIVIADGGGITVSAGLTSTAAANTLGATSFNDAAVTSVGTINGVGISYNITNFSQSLLISNDAGTGTLDSASNNTGLGHEVFDDLTSGDDNTGVGNQALTKLTTGGQNTAVGSLSLDANTTATGNTAFGYSSLTANTTGDRNVAIGWSAMSVNVDGDRGTALGYAALQNQEPSTASDTYNVAIGYAAGNAISTGLRNTALGGLALDALTTENDNTAIGYNALGAEVSGFRNVAVGSSAGTTQNGASNNTLVGYVAGGAITTGAANTFIGSDCGDATTTADNNTAVGSQAMGANTTGASNVAVGKDALTSNTTAGSNTALGAFSLDATTTGGSNTAVGANALGANTTAAFNSALGDNSLATNTTGASNVGLGYHALRLNQTGSNNVAIGASDNSSVGAALGALTTGGNNTAVGQGALTSQTTSSSNTAVGYSAARDLTTATGTCAIGASALERVTTATNNTAFGAAACKLNTSGASNTGVGNGALFENTTGDNNTAVGQAALQNAASSNNTAVGQNAGTSVTTGASNTFVGYAAGDAITTTTRNCIIGDSAGTAVTSSDNTFVGQNSGAAMPTSNPGDANTFLGRYNGNEGSLDLRNSSNNIVLSDGDGNPRLHINASGTTNMLDLNINSTGSGDVANAIRFDRNSDINSGGDVRFVVFSSGNVQNTNNSYAGISDIKLKENVVDATNKLDELNQVKIRNWNFIGETKKQIGVVAQELELIFPGLVETIPDTDKDGNDLGTETKSVKYSVFVPMLIKAMQEQQTLIESLTARITTLEG